MTWEEFAQSHRPALEEAVKQECALIVGRYEGLPESSALAGLLCSFTLRGKLLRGLFVRLSALSWGGAGEGALNTAGACVELAQSAFLIHDDIMDQDEFRRGEPSVHTRIGENPAVCLGDLALLHIFESLAFNAGLVRVFSRRLSATALGQAHEVGLFTRREPSPEEILEIIRYKTARYTFVLPFEAGAVLAGAQPDPALEALGLALGDIFQVRDDELNLLASGQTGKSSGGDIRENKKTLCRAVLLKRMPEASVWFGKEGTLQEVREAYQGSGAAREIAAFLDARTRHARALLEALPLKQEIRPLWDGLLWMLQNRSL